MLKILKLIKICKFKVLIPSYLKKINRQETEMIFLSATKFKIIDYKDFIIYLFSTCDFFIINLIKSNKMLVYLNKKCIHVHKN